MIDIHCHILPDVDDGAINESAAIEMARRAVAEGITQIVATPHHRKGRWRNDREKIMYRVAQLNEQLNQQLIPLKILSGQEIRVFGEMGNPERLRRELMTFNDSHRYILVELPTRYIPPFAAQLFFHLQLNGITPVIAHPERNDVFVEHPYKLWQLINEGALAQITAASLIGKNGRKTQKRSFQFLENGLAHFIASDAHDTIKRPFFMQEAHACIKEAFNPKVNDLLNENAKKLICGETIVREQPIIIREKRLFGLL